MNKLVTTSMLVLAIGLAGCAKKERAADLPPPVNAPTSTAPAPAAAADSGIATGAVPGSQADLVATAGSDRVLFEYDSFELSGEAQAILQRQAQWLQRYPAVSLTIEGHADERGTREYNLALGDRRANAVKNFLAANAVAASRLRTISYGKERPEIQGSDDVSHAQNRRAVSVVTGGPTS
jgi:peptidoglycan-associated lipoprotein